MKEFKKDLEQLIHRLELKKPFTFSKYADGEFAILINQKITNCDKWTFDNVTLVANEQGLNRELPFKVDNYIPIKIGSWLNPDLDIIIEKMKKLATNAYNQLFLFSAGPLGNILAHQLHELNSENTYIDIGSTINPWVTRDNRGYLKENAILKTCIW
jgi:hypothetical protein